MGFFKDAQNILITGGSFSNAGSVNTYHSFLSTSSYCSSSALSSPSGANSLPEGSVYNTAEEEKSLDPKKRKPLGYFDETAGEWPDAPESGEGSKIKETDDKEGIVSDDDRPNNTTYQFYNCQAVYMHAFNAFGNKVKDSGNNAPRLIHHGGTVVVGPSDDLLLPYTNEGAPSLPKLSRPTAASPLSRQAAQSEHPVGISSGSRRNNPFLNQFMVVPPSDISLLTLEGGQGSISSVKGGKRPATIEIMQTDDATSHQPTSMMPAPTTLPGTAFQQLPINPLLPMHMGLYPNFLSHIQPFPSDLQDAPPNITANTWTDLQPNRHPSHYLPKSSLATNSSPDANSKCLQVEHHLDAALAAALSIDTSRSSAEILTPRAQNTLKAFNALVSMETPVSSPRTTASRRRVAKWLQIPWSQPAQGPT